MNKLRYLIRLIVHGVPLGVVFLVGGLVAVAADLIGWRWLTRLDLWLRGEAEAMIANFSNR